MPGDDLVRLAGGGAAELAGLRRAVGVSEVDAEACRLFGFERGVGPRWGTRALRF